MSSTQFPGGFGPDAYALVEAINTAYWLVGSSNSVQGPCAFADGLDTDQIDSITITDGGQYVGLPTGGNALSTNLVISGTKVTKDSENGKVGFANLADASASLKGGGIQAVQDLINEWAHAKYPTPDPAQAAAAGGFTEVAS